MKFHPFLPTLIRALRRSTIFAAMVITGTLLSANEPSEIHGELVWPDEWTVFAPFERTDQPAADQLMDQIPETFRTVGEGLGDTDHGEEKEVRGEVVTVEPGKPFDLLQFFDEQSRGNTAYVFLELESDRDQDVTIGVGADWWVEIMLNGEPVFDTLAHGNDTWPVSMTNHTFEVSMKEGKNVLAIRFIAGNSSSALAVGGPAEFVEEMARLAEWERARKLNQFPEKFEDRMIFPEETQAVIMAERGLQLPHTDADLATGALVGLQPMPSRQLQWQPGGDILDVLDPRFDEPVRVILSKFRYPWEDRALDAIVWTTPPESSDVLEGRLEVVLKDGRDRELVRHEIDELSPSGWFFSLGFPGELKGEAGVLEVVWMDGDEEIGRARAGFEVDEPADVAGSGRVPLEILNEPGVTMNNAPMTVGVPFPRGALWDEANVRLVDEEGGEQPLQTRVTAKWARYGPVKWLLCDFTVDLDGAPRQWALEYGPGIERAKSEPMVVEENGESFPGLDTGRLRVGEKGVEFDRDGDGEFEPVLSPEALTGAFVCHEKGICYTVASGVTHSVEEIGSNKVLIRRTGWYEDAESGEKFCQYVTRLAFYRGSPVVRIYHTWIFTGDGNRDRITEMGWRFGTAGEISSGEILTGFGEGNWETEEGLVQFDFDEYLWVGSGEEKTGRTPGVMSVEVGANRVGFGVKDFWQNFPSELEIKEEAFTFYNWPKRNPPARFERPVQTEDAFRLRFVHEGEMLDFRIPGEYAEGEIWRSMSNNGREPDWAEGEPDTVNAQGIARTEEMFLYFAGEDQPLDEAAKVMRGLNDETLRTVVDPLWMSASGVFGKIHPRDPEGFPEEERIYEITMEAPAKWVERLGFYGMWVHGDYPTWNLDLTRATVSPYRTLRKNHHSYPLRLIPFIRSGEPKFLKLAENAARQMTDASFCHFASEEVDIATGPEYYRRQGTWWDAGLLPWSTRVRRGPELRSYAVDTDFMWDIYYATGYSRARDVALLFGELTQHDYANGSNVFVARAYQSVLTSYLDMYQATFDPWFLAAIHALTASHMDEFGGREMDPFTTTARDAGRETWRRADQAYYEFSGCEDYEEVARNSAVAYSSPWRSVGGLSGGHGGGPTLALAAWRHTGDPMYLGRAAAILDYMKLSAYVGDIEYYRGMPYRTHGGAPASHADSVPMVMAALIEAGVDPDPMHEAMPLSGSTVPTDDEEIYVFRFPEVFVKKTGQEPLELRFNARGQGATGHADRPFEYRIVAPGEEEISGEGNAPEIVEIVGGEGVYKVELGGRLQYPEGTTDRPLFQRTHGRWFFPLTPPEVPEVIRFEPGETRTDVQALRQGFWFYVPEGTEEFWIEFSGGRRTSVWNPDGERVWDHSSLGDDPDPERAVIPVPQEQGGQLWRATGGSFTIDSQIPPYFSATRSKWFNPQEDF